MKPIKFLLFPILALLAACTAAPDAGDTGFTADRTPIIIGQLAITGTASTRVTNPANGPVTWTEGDQLTVEAPHNKQATFTYTTSGVWRRTGGDILYMEDYAAGDEFTAWYGGDSSTSYIQSTPDRYTASTWLEGYLQLTGNTLSGALTHQRVDVVLNIERGSEWTEEDFLENDAFTVNINGYTPWNSETTTTTRTYRAQMFPGEVPAPGETLFTITRGTDVLEGTYSRTDGTNTAPTAGQRLTVDVKYHLGGGIATTNGATVTDFTSEDIQNPPTEITTHPHYKYVVYDWETLKNALASVQDGESILQIANISCPEEQGSRTVKHLPDGALYNGGGYTITGLQAELFNMVQSDARVYNVHLRDCHITDGSRYTGLLANVNTGLITRCSVGGTVKAITDGRAGGLVGYNSGGGIITRCYTDATVTGTSGATIGGLVGWNDGTIVACAAKGKVVGNGASRVGTLVGFNDGTIGGTIYYAYATAKGDLIGGGYGDINNTDPILAETIVEDESELAGIKVELRTFDKEDPGWWFPDEEEKIDWRYEGAQ